MSEILKIDNVYKYFGKFAANDGVSFGLKEGGIYLLVGPNGCGKSTLVNCISGIFVPEEGHVAPGEVMVGAGYHEAFLFWQGR